MTMKITCPSHFSLYEAREYEIWLYSITPTKIAAGMFFIVEKGFGLSWREHVSYWNKESSVACMHNGLEQNPLLIPPEFARSQLVYRETRVGLGSSLVYIFTQPSVDVRLLRRSF